MMDPRPPPSFPRPPARVPAGRARSAAQPSEGRQAGFAGR
jgi:hypothetical protein